MSIEKIGVQNKEELEQMITKEMNQIEKSLTVVCSHVPVNDNTSLDILCHDDNGQLVVLQLNVDEDDHMLLQGIQSLDYVDKFKSFLKATYSKNKIDDKETPRLILIAPSFSETLRHAVEHMQGIRVDLYEWEYLKLGDHKGLRLLPIFAGKPKERTKEEKEKKSTEKKRESKTEKKKEPTAEKEEEPESPEPPSEPSRDDFPEFLIPADKAVEEDKEEKEEIREESKKEPQKRKIRLF